MRVPVCAAAILVLAGCGTAPDPAVGPGADVTYGSFGTKADIDCGEGRSLSIGGSNNSLTVLGRCSSVTVGGADNTVTLHQVDGELSVTGLNNTVRYRSGDPAVTDTGSNNRISRA